MLHVKIIDCTGPKTWWYSDKIGKVFRIDSERASEYIIKEKTGAACIKRADAKEVKLWWPWRLSRDTGLSKYS